MHKVTEGQHIQQESRSASAASMLEFASRNSKLSCCEEKTSTRAQNWRAYMSTSGGKKMDYNEKKVSTAESVSQVRYIDNMKRILITLMQEWNRILSSKCQDWTCLLFN